MKYLEYENNEKILKYIVNLIDWKKEKVDKNTIIDNLSVIYEDASGSSSIDLGSWATIVQKKQGIISDSNVCKGVLNDSNVCEPIKMKNIMHLNAVIKGLEIAEKSKYIVIVTDSNYIDGNLNKNKFEEWKTKDWQIDNKSIIKNRNLWEEIIRLTEDKKVIVFRITAKEVRIELQKSCHDRVYELKRIYKKYC